MLERRRELHAHYVSGLQAFGAFDQFKGYAIAFSEGFETVSRDCGEVNEYIIATFLLKKPKTLAVVKPFYSSVYHFYFLLILLFKFVREYPRTFVHTNSFVYAMSN